jgi:UDP-2,4-diacetamido-2,4,6-trideoxy-beta-L-altropyranose hydrolase
MSRKAVFRVDASLAIGTGHVYRCMALANALRDSGWHIIFLCRAMTGNLIDKIRYNGFKVVRLPDDPLLLDCPLDAWPPYAVSLDKQMCQAIIRDLKPDLVVVDHYALQSGWETVTIPSICRTVVISDLFTFAHAADILINQNLGAEANAYTGLVSDNCHLLLGQEYAMLRPNFSILRAAALARRSAFPRHSTLRLLLSLGGVDATNVTGWALQAMQAGGIFERWTVDVVLGGGAPHREKVAVQVSDINQTTTLHVDTRQMAEIMARSDVAVGAAGSTSWERCCLGLPTVMLVLAENQRLTADALQSASAATLVEPGDTTAFLAALEDLECASRRVAMSNACSVLCDGAGISRVLVAINQLFEVPLDL